MGKPQISAAVRQDVIRRYQAGQILSQIRADLVIGEGSLHRILEASGVNRSRRSARKQAIKNCLNCGCLLSKTLQKKYCSTKCSRAHSGSGRKNGPPKNCPHCGAAHRKNIYCSRKCSALAQSPNRDLTPAELAEKKRVNNLSGVRRYQVRLLGQTPLDADIAEIKRIYANCPPGHEVDHITPISKGGLHTPGNLQYLPATENRRKSNKLNWTRS